MTKSVLPVGLLALAAFGAFGQEGAKAPEFEAASIKPSEPLNTGAMMAGGRMQIRMGCSTPDPGRFNCTGMPLRMLVVRAYGVKNYQVSGPAWMDSDRFDVNAKIPAGATQDQFKLMLQKLLADRFQMTVHRENKEMPVYALVVGKNGPKLKPAADEQGKESPADDALAGRGIPPPPPGGGGQQNVMVMRSGGPGRTGGGGSVTMSTRNGLSELVAKKSTVADLAGILSNQVDRPVVDQTGIQGEFDFTLDFAPDESMRPSGPMGGMAIGVPGPSAGSGGGGAAPGTPGAEPRDPSSAPSIFSAIQNQLGLKLEPKKAPMETIVVEKAEKLPAEN
jgi:uncharacterized protein (TIGR03435 family)